MTTGVFTLAAKQVTVALTAEAQSAIEDLEGMSGVSLHALFQYGSGGTTAIAVVQTEFDGNWIDIARFDFAQASATKVANLSGLLSKAVAAYATLSAEGVLDGILGGSLRCVLTTTGVYANTNLAIRVSIR